MRRLNSYVSSTRGFTLIEVIVALALLSLGVAGVAQLRHSAFQHLMLTQEIQEASYFASSHLATLNIDDAVPIGVQSGEYSRGLGVETYPWQLRLLPLSDDALQPESISLSEKVHPLVANLSVWVDQGTRELRFHTLVLAKPIEKQESGTPRFKIESGI